MKEDTKRGEAIERFLLADYDNYQDGTDLSPKENDDK